MKVQINSNWEKLLNSEFRKPYFTDLVDFVKNAYSKTVCYPPGKDIFRAFNECPLDDVKVVIIGQDPYHGPKQAHGYCFSVSNSISHPPSLINIFKEIQTDLGLEYPKSGDLTPWARQGVFLLNATLTVEANKAGSHQKIGWETFTDSVIRIISEKKENIVFMLWGSYAKQKTNLIDSLKHRVLKSGHPSPLSANRGFWFGNKHFSKCNSYLKEVGKNEINWSLDK